MEESSVEGERETMAKARLTQRRKELFGDCRLIEIIHLHDCLRGELNALEKGVLEVSQSLLDTGNQEILVKLEKEVTSRFQIIWSVFKAHSSAEDEFIWPTLRSKTKGKVTGSPSYRPDQDAEDVPQDLNVVEQEEYEEDHADEERMFSTMNRMLIELRHLLSQPTTALSKTAQPTKTATGTSIITDEASIAPTCVEGDSVHEVMQQLNNHVKHLSRHLQQHLEKEENQCMPLVVKHLTKDEIHDLVGKIMGKRSCDMIAQIMTMAVQNLGEAERAQMVDYMKEAMAGTFFDRWLAMSGWMEPEEKKEEPAETADASNNKRTHEAGNGAGEETKRIRLDQLIAHAIVGKPAQTTPKTAELRRNLGSRLTTEKELEKLIRAVATNPTLSSKQKNTTIQGLRQSIWKRNQGIKKQAEAKVESKDAPACSVDPSSTTPSATAKPVMSGTCIPTQRGIPPTQFFVKNSDGKTIKAWDSSDSITNSTVPVPTFSTTELAPTFHDGASGAVLGCPHYARSCKLRHPVSGRLYTCRLCCEQDRENPAKEKDEPLDRYTVKEVMCMKCNTLQPARDKCLNSSCESHDKSFAKYFCRICHLYDNRPRPIFHCPYCNTCRMGKGLGIDFYHCVRCNACVSMDDKEHRCIPQKLESTCPICHDTLFQSTEALKGLKCGHVMHLSCFTKYRRSQSYTCPICKKCMEDMNDYFALLDAAVRMQPMPFEYMNTYSNIYCQDCQKSGQCKYHFVGQKCPTCGSYNTRELGRVQAQTTPVAYT
ncbi:unnamed protein product [Cylindrotheca closterium]|uniref:Uncharacterized protein n=1 Tax=Cylindrotheca closterium TaxID=2856 RepID=A0AAD2GAC2_9STRA|nr:unnamed protein product [Cylindrotheca closterium]